MHVVGLPPSPLKHKSRLKNEWLVDKSEALQHQHTKQLIVNLVLHTYSIVVQWKYHLTI